MDREMRDVADGFGKMAEVAEQDSVAREAHIGEINARIGATINEARDSLRKLEERLSDVLHGVGVETVAARLHVGNPTETSSPLRRSSIELQHLAAELVEEIRTLTARIDL